MATVILALLALMAGWMATADAYAAEFSWQLSGSLGTTDRSEDFDADHASLTATHYFDGVDDGRGPYALASFLDPASRLSLSVNRDEQTSEIALPSSTIALPGLESKTRSYGVSGAYVLPRSKWYFGGHYSSGDVDDPPGSPVLSTDLDDYGVIVGKYLGASTTLEFAAETSAVDSEQTFTVCVLFQACFNAGRLGVELERDTLSLEAYHVRHFRALTYALFGGVAETDSSFALRVPSFTLPPIVSPPLPPFMIVPTPPIVVPSAVTVSAPDSVRVVSAGTELFPTRKLGVRVAYARSHGDPSSKDAYEVATTWYFRRNVSLQLGFARRRGDNAVLGDTDHATLRAIGRF